MGETVTHSFVLTGRHTQLFFCRDSEVLVEGPVGTGKTRNILEYVLGLCETYPGIRVLLVRKTRASLTESVLVTWENETLPGGTAHPCVNGRATAANRRAYVFPWRSRRVHDRTYSGQSVVVCGGLDRVSRWFSTQFDIICVFEAREVTEEDWEGLLTRNRNYAMPWNQAIADTNPDDKYHWLNLRAERPIKIPARLRHVLPAPRPGQKQITRIITRIDDNPRYWNRALNKPTPEGAAYLLKIEGITGARYHRLVEGVWCGSEGQVWPEFDRDRHMTFRVWQATLPQLKADKHPRYLDGARRGELKLDWYFGSMDWGHRKAGCLQIWGVIGAFERMYRLHEVYAQGKQLEWWAESVGQYDRRYNLRAIVADPSRSDLLEGLNDRIMEWRGRKSARIVIEANNAREAGWDMVRWGLDPGAALRRMAEQAGEQPPVVGPRLFLCSDASDYFDNELAAAKKPTSTEEEISGYCWRKAKDGQPIKEETDPNCEDHGCDAMRYAAMYAWCRDLTDPTEKPKFDPGSMGDVLDHGDVRFDEAA